MTRAVGTPFLGAFALLLLSGCPGFERPPLPSIECVYTSDCQVGETCTPAGLCAPECQESRDCPAAYSCVEGACSLGEGRCLDENDCTEGEMCAANGSCASFCSDSGDCAEGESCLSGMCLALEAQCVRNSDCSDGDACVGGQCAAACIDDRDCPAGTGCNSGSCTLPVPDCLTAAECTASETCSPTGDCVATCTTTAECGGGDDVVCSNGACLVADATTASISGLVELTGLADHSGVRVVLSGPAYVEVTTPPSGAFSFEALPAGRYRLSHEAASTLEETAHQDLIAGSGATVVASTASFTPAGSISGTVTRSGAASHGGIQVFAEGTPASAVTDASGAFLLSGVPAGTHDLTAIYPGFVPNKLIGVAVAYDETTAASTFQLIPQEAGESTSFAFSSTPPVSGMVETPYSYQAIANGPDVSTVTYGLAAGPVGMDVDSVTGAVSWTPHGAQLGDHVVALSAAGGGALVYQVFTLSVAPAYETLLSQNTDQLAVGGDVIWANHYGSLSRIEGTQITTFVSGDGAITGTGESIALTNGGAITSASAPRITVDALAAPVGTLSLDYPSGTIASASVPGLRELAGISVLGGEIDAIAFPNQDVITAVTLEGGGVDSPLVDPRRPLGALSFDDTGTIGALTATTLEDLSSTWAVDALVGRCVRSAQSGVLSPITANDATSLTTDGTDPLTDRLLVGHRYFIVDCGSGALTVTLTESTPGVLNGSIGEWIDVYRLGEPLLVAEITAVATDAVTFGIDPEDYPLLSAGGGEYAIGTSGGHSLVVTDASLSLTPGALASTRFLVFHETPTQRWTITDNDETSVTFQLALTALSDLDFGATGWRLTEKSNPYYVATTVTVASGGLTPSAHAAEFLYVDTSGYRYDISDNGADTYLLAVRNEQLGDPNDWIDSAVATASGTSTYPNLPDLVLTDADAGLLPNAFAGGGVHRLVDGTARRLNEHNVWQTVSQHDATSITLETWSQHFTYARPGWLSDAQGYVGDRYGVSTSYASNLLLTVEIAGTPLEPDTFLNGETLQLLDGSNLRSYPILGNSASSVRVTLNNENAWVQQEAIPVGTPVYLPEVGLDQVVLEVDDVTGGFAPDEHVGKWLVLEACKDPQSYPRCNNHGGTVGEIVWNDGDTLRVVATDLDNVRDLAPGGGYALAEPVGECFDGGPIPVTATLAGATLEAVPYDTLTGSTNVAVEVDAVLGGDVSLAVCPSELQDLLASAGLPAALSTNGATELSITDSAAPLDPGSLVGRELHGYPGGDQTSMVVTDNTADAVMVEVDPSDALTALPLLNLGSELTFAREGFVEMTLGVDRPLTPGALEKLQLLLHRPGSTLPAHATVTRSDTSSLSVEWGATQLGNLVFGEDTALYDRFTVTDATAIRLTDDQATFTPGALVGRELVVGGHTFRIVANTATTLDAATPNTSYASAMQATRGSLGYRVEGLTDPWELAATSTGEVFALTGGGTVQQLDETGTMTTHTPEGTARRLDVTPVPRTLLEAETYLHDYDTGAMTFTNPAWSFTPGEWVSGYILHRRYPFTSSFAVYRVLANTETTLTVDGIPITSPSHPRSFWLVPYRLTVTSETLTPDELAGGVISINGVQHRITGNSSDEIQLAIPANNETPVLMPAPPWGATALVEQGFPFSSLGGLTSDGGQGIWARSELGLSHFDGASWTFLRHETTGRSAGTGTISDVNGNYVYFSGLSVYPGELDDGWLVTASGRWPINTNDSSRLTLSGDFPQDGPMHGEAFEVFAETLEGPRELSAAGANLWVGARNGVYHHDGATWTRYTPMGSESSPGLRDGVPDGVVTAIAAEASGGAWMANPDYSAPDVRHFDGSTWTVHSAASTESSPGADDGLPAERIVRIRTLPSGRVGFLSDYDLATMLQSSTFERLGPADGHPAFLEDVAELSDGTLVFGGNSGVTLAP